MDQRVLCGTLALVLGSSPSSWARPEGVPGEVPLASGAELETLCNELRDGPAADQAPAVHVVTLPSRSFSFLPFDRHRGRLDIDANRGFRGTGAWELVLYDLTGSAAPPPGALELSIPADSEEATRLSAAQERSELNLVLWFRPTGRPPCANVHGRGQPKGIRMAVVPLALALVRGTETVATAETSEFAALRSEKPLVDRPDVVVVPPVVTRTGKAAPAGVAQTLAALRPELRTCYARGLAVAPDLRGSLVIGISLEASGRATEVRPELDGLLAPQVTQCALERIRDARFPKGRAARFSLLLRFVQADES